jgi:hypothetical protein
MRYIPMINEKDILARLQAGEDAQKIADEMANMLNAANATYLAEQEAKKKAEAEAAKKAAEASALEEEKNELAQIIADAVMDYIDVCAPDLIDDDEDPLDGAEVRKLLDGMIPLMVSLKGLQTAGINPFGTPILTPPVAKMGNGTPIVKMSDDEIIKNFLSKNVH